MEPTKTVHHSLRSVRPHAHVSSVRTDGETRMVASATQHESAATRAIRSSR